MKKSLAIRVFSIFTICLLLLSTLVIGILNAYTVTKFKDGTEDITATLPGPVSMEIELPEDANVTTATIDISTVKYGDKYARNPELRLTDISDPLVWAYKDVGYGDFGNQIYFNNSVPFNEITYKPGAIDKTTGIYLPKGATIESAKVNLTATEHDYWEPGVTQLNPPDWGNNPPFDMDPILTVWNNKLICVFRSYNWDETNETDGDLVVNYTSDGITWLPSPAEITQHPDTEVPYLGGLRCGDYHPAALVYNNDLWVTWGSESDYQNVMGAPNHNGAGITDGPDRDIVIRKINNLQSPTTGFTEITHPTGNAAEDTYSNNDDTFLWTKDDRRVQITEFNNKMWVTWVANNTDNTTFHGDRIGDVMVSSSAGGTTWSSGVNLCAGDPWYAVDTWSQIAVFNNKLYVMWVTNNSGISNGTDWDIVYRATSDGISWDAVKEITPIDDGDWSDDDCKLIVFGNELCAIWRTRNPELGQGPDFDIVIRSTSDGSTWGATTQVGDFWNGAFDNKPYPIVFDNELYVFWRSEQGGEGDIRVSSYHDGEWTEEQQCSIRKGDGDNFYVAAATFGNKLYAAWVTQDDTLTEGDDADVVIRSMTPSNLPLLVKLDIGSDGDYEFNSGLSASTVTLDVTTEIQSLVNDPPSGVIQFTDDYGNQMVNISMLLEITGPGEVKIDGLEIVYKATLTTRNINEHLNEYLKNRKDTAVNGQITVPMTLTAQNDAKIKLSNINIEYGIKPKITLITPVTGRTDALENYFDINWTDYDPDDDAQIALYYDDDKKGYDGTLIVENLTELDEVEEDSYHWTWTSDTMDDGDYYVYASITDGQDTAWDYSDGYVHIVVRETTPPTIVLQSPKKKDELAWKSYEIKWTDDDPDSNARIKLFYNSPPYEILDWVQIDLDEDGFITSNDVIYEDQDGDFDAYTWDISTFSEGMQYKIRAYIEDDDMLDHTDESSGNILITQIPAPTNLSIVDGKMVSVGVYETHDLYPQLEWERPDIALDMFFYGKIYEGTTNSGDEVFDINTSDTSVPISEELVYGNTYYVELYAMSSLGALSPTTSMTFNVVNNLPSAPQIRISPAKPYASNSLRCEITNNSVDEDEDPVDYSYMWYKNGDHQPLYDDIANIPSDATSKTDVWKVVVTPFDGIEDGITSEVTVTVLNSAPSITINSPGSGLKAKSSDLILFSGSISDFDTDTVEYRITSSIDGELESQTDPSGGGSFKLSKKLSPGEHNITIWASDGQSNVTKTFPVSISKADEDTDTEDAIWWALIIIVIVVVIIAALLVIRKRRRSGEEIPPPIEEYPAEGGEGEGDDAFDEYGEFKKPEDEVPEETDETKPPETK